jgi:hypothetical protein
MPGLVPGIHLFFCCDREKTWMAGTSPAMTNYFYAATTRRPGSTISTGCDGLLSMVTSENPTSLS